MEEDINFPKQVVLDTSLVLNFLMPNEHTPPEVDLLFEQVKDKKIKAYAPVLIYYEAANALRSAVLQKRASQRVALDIFRGFTNLGLIGQEIDHIKALQLAIKKEISVYDASYVYLANILKLHLATADKRMAGFSKRHVYFGVKQGKLSVK